MKLIPFAILFLCCSGSTIQNQSETSSLPGQAASCNGNEKACALQERFCPPEGYSRINVDSTGFGAYLRQLPLKPSGSQVKLFDGRIKDSAGVYRAVVDMEISAVDLQQCADAVMRLRAEYLFAAKRYSEISFRFTGDGNMHSYSSYAGTDRTYRKFRKYMDHVFAYANTASLKKQLKPRKLMQMQPGDVFIQSGNPYGHAVMVVDMCNDNQGRKKFMLAQSYMPAQEIQILINPLDNSVWYSLDSEGILQTPEWTFNLSDLRTW